MRYQWTHTDARVFVVMDGERVMATIAGSIDGGGYEQAAQDADDIASALAMLDASRRRRENPRDRQQSLI